MVLNEYLAHYVEFTLPGDSERSFRRAGPSFSSRSCFALTATGVDLAAGVGREASLLRLHDADHDGKHPADSELSRFQRDAGGDKTSEPLPQWSDARQGIVVSRAVGQAISPTVPQPDHRAARISRGRVVFTALTIRCRPRQNRSQSAVCTTRCGI